MSRFAQLSNHGLSISLPSGWDAEIFVRDVDGDPTDDVADFKPVVHAANFALPPGRGDFGSIAVELMDRPAVFLAVIEFDNASASSPLFSNPVPTSLTADEFAPTQLQRPLPGQAGAQRFVNSGGRAFCVYAVLGSYALRNVLVPELNAVLATLSIEPL